MANEYKIEKPEEENSEYIRRIIRDELTNILGIDKYIFDKNIQILDIRNIQTGRTNGTKISTEIDQKIGFHGATPTIQRSGSSQEAVATTGATQTTPYGYTTAAQANGIVTLLNEIRASLVEKGIIKGSAS